MTYHGTVRNGIVVPQAEAALPEGATVRIEIEPAVGDEESLPDFLRRFAGKAEGLPPDMAAEHDHYIHGTPKRSEQRE